MGEKEGILQFLFHSLMIRQQPRHVACLECLSLYSEHESYCVRTGKKGIYVAISVHTHTKTHAQGSCVRVCVCTVCVGSLPTAHCEKG